MAVLDPNCTENALQGFSEVTSATLSHCSSGYEEREGSGVLLAGALPLGPRAHSSCSGKCTLIIIAVEQKGLQATRRVGPFLETQSCEFLEERQGSPCSAGVLPYKSLRAGKPHTCGKEYELPAAPRLGGDDGALWQVAYPAEPGTVLVPQAASGREETCSSEPAGGMLSTEETGEEKPPGESQSNQTGRRGRCCSSAKPWA